MNPLLIILLLGAGVFYLSKGSSIPETEVKRCSIQLLTLDALNFATSSYVLKVSVAIDNPTKHLLSADLPIVKLLYNGSQVATSQDGNTTQTLKAGTRTLVKDLKVSFPLSSTLIVATYFTDKQDKDFIVEVSTAINGNIIKSSRSFKISDLVSLYEKK